MKGQNKPFGYAIEIAVAWHCGLRDSSKNNRHVSHKADHDDECRFELFLLDEGQQKVEEKAETRKYNTTSPHIRPSQD